MTWMLAGANNYITKILIKTGLSGGEKQRIGIARAFLHDAPLLLLDEPTSNLDSLNEGIILKSLKESAGQKTVVLVSHRTSTMSAAQVVYEMENGRISWRYRTMKKNGSWLLRKVIARGIDKESICLYNAYLNSRLSTFPWRQYETE